MATPSFFPAPSAPSATGRATQPAAGSRPPRAVLADLADLAMGGHDLLLLLSHMRSYSSLLAHLLGSSEQIAGSGEQHLRYRHAGDLWRLRRRVLAERSRGASAARPRWLLDKQLHDASRPADRLLPAERSRALIFLRAPAPTLASILALAQRRQQRNGCADALADPQRACDYYVARLHHLRQDAERLGRRALGFDAELLPARPEALLQGIAGWLGLDRVPSTQYQATARTGQEGYGDWGDNIHAGVVLDASHGSGAGRGGLLPPAVLAEAEAAHRRCREALKRHCATLGMD